MKLYHVSLGENSLIKEFTPRIPEHTFTVEDHGTPRICCSTTVSGCLTAVANYTFGEIIPNDTVLTLYSCEIDDSVKYYDTDFLIKSRLTPNAYYEKEVWLLEPVTMQGQVFRLTNATWTYTDIITLLSVTVYKLLNDIISVVGVDKFTTEELEYLKSTNVNYILNNSKVRNILCEHRVLDQIRDKYVTYKLSNCVTCCLSRV